MFRIKTDIRHYRCESRDKVERLIRNWVIRPSDLIYDDTDDEWQPIGTHGEFVDLFESLDEKHENQPETVVTDRAAHKAATDRSSRPDTSPNGGSAPRAAVLQKPARSDEPGSDPKTVVAEGDDADTTPEPPEPPEDVEGVLRDSDEITVMTDRTFSMMLEEGDAEISCSQTSGPDRARPDEPTARIEHPANGTAERARPDEPTARIEHPADDAPDRARPDEPTARIEHPADDDPERARPDEPTALIDDPLDRQAPTEDADPPGADETTDPFEDSDRRDDDAAPPKSEGDSPAGRHDLPAHLFETAELDDEAEKLETSSGADTETTSRLFESVSTADPAPPARRIVEYEAVVPASDQVGPEPDTTGEDAVDPLADTGEFDEPSYSDDVDVAPLDDTDEIDGEDIAADPVDQTEQTEQTDEVDDPGRDDAPAAADRSPSPEEAGEDDEVEEISAVDIDPVDEDDLEEAPVADGVTPDDATDDDPPMVEVDPVEESVYDGYDVEFLIPIEPTERSLELGLQKSSVSKWTRSRLFPEPEPSTPGEVVTRSYDLDDDSRPEFPLPVSGRTAVVAACAVVAIVVLIVVLIT